MYKSKDGLLPLSSFLLSCQTFVFKNAPLCLSKMGTPLMENDVR